jgi:dienelactone hydrolase
VVKRGKKLARNAVAVKRSYGFQSAQSAALIALGLVLGPLTAPAADDPQASLIYSAVRKKHPDLATICPLDDAQRRQIVVQATIELATSRKVSDPMVSGPLAGDMLRQACGISTGNSTNAGAIRWAVSGQTLSMDGERRELSAFTSVHNMANRVYAPNGAGPFPAVVLNTTIGSVSQHLLVQAKALLESGFAVMVVDSYGPRNLRPGEVLIPAEMVNDAYGALALLQGLPYIDAQRIYQSGYSLGAMTAAMLASPEGAQKLGAKGRFRATVGHYGNCTTPSGPIVASGDKALEWLSSDSDRPVLMLMAQMDLETPPKTCFPLLETMKAAGKPVDWHIYPNTTHGWDKAENNGYIYRAPSGENMTYRYDAQVTRDATQRMIAFFNLHR